MGGQVTRTIAFYAKDSDAFIGEFPLRGVDLEALQRLFDVPAEDPMCDCWPVGPEQAAALQPFVSGPIDLERYDYFLESHAASRAGVAASRGVDGYELEGE